MSFLLLSPAYPLSPWPYSYPSKSQIHNHPSIYRSNAISLIKQRRNSIRPEHHDRHDGEIPAYHSARQLSILYFHFTSSLIKVPRENRDIHHRTPTDFLPLTRPFRWRTSRFGSRVLPCSESSDGSLLELSAGYGG
jgi:hypothetical protein